MSLCLRPLELMQILPLTSAGLDLTLSLRSRPPPSPSWARRRTAFNLRPLCSERRRLETPWLWWAPLEHFRLLETSSPSPASSEAYERHHQWHAANYWCVMVEAWPTPCGGSPDARTSPGWNRCSRAKSCWYQAHLTSSSCWGGTTLLHLPLAWHLLEVFFSYCKHGRVDKKCSVGHDHLGRQMMVTSLLCLNVEYVLKTPNY